MPRLGRKKKKDSDTPSECPSPLVLDRSRTKSLDPKSSTNSTGSSQGLLSSLSSSLRRPSSASNLLRMAESSQVSTPTVEKSSTSFFARLRQSFDERGSKDLDKNSPKVDSAEEESNENSSKSSEIDALSLSERHSQDPAEFHGDDSEEAEEEKVSRKPSALRTMTVPLISVQHDSSDSAEHLSNLPSRSNSRRANTMLETRSVPNTPPTRPSNGTTGGPFNRLKKKTFSRLFSSDIPALPSPSADGSQSAEPRSPSTPYSPLGTSLPAYGFSPSLPSSLKSSPELVSINERGASESSHKTKLSRSGSLTDSLHSLAGAISRPDSRSEHQNPFKSSSTISLTLPPLVRSLSSQSSRDESADTNHSNSPRPRSRTLNSLNQIALGNDDSNHRVERPGSALANLSRPSFGSLFTSRLRSDSGGSSSAAVDNLTAFSTVSPRHSAEEEVDLPDVLDGESEQDYVDRIKTLLVGRTAAALSKHDDDFTKRCLYRYVDSYMFTDEPLDMALRKFLMYVRLPKETQQIDRILDAFSKTYYENNKDIYSSSESVYVVAFSLMILHTDCFNPSNRHKMLKSEYIRNIHAKDVSADILEVGCCSFFLLLSFFKLTSAFMTI